MLFVEVDDFVNKKIVICHFSFSPQIKNVPVKIDACSPRPHKVLPFQRPAQVFRALSQNGGAESSAVSKVDARFSFESSQCPPKIVENRYEFML
jgi:hypothetical protein